ncbi:MAG: hypothetical protein U5J64_06845 [Halobacteriales archaeon]|nr:hypothetical protein [Halobacteriales archaeon]
MYSDTIAEILYALDPRRFTKIDAFFLFSFLVLLSGALVMFQTRNVMWALTSLIGMFLAFCSMLLCIGVEDLFEREELKDDEDSEEESNGLGGGTSMKRDF